MSGGGTGGHIYPALAIADALKVQRPDAEFLFIGARGKMEMQRIPAAGYSIVGVPISGFHRKLDMRNLLFPFKLIGGLTTAFSAVRSFKPDAAVGTGGFASGPALAAAAALGVPVFLQEQNAYPGITNRLLGRVAKHVFTAYEEAHHYFGSARAGESASAPAHELQADGHKVLLTGNPLRSSLSQNKLHPAATAKAHYGLDPKVPTLLSFGGSLGSLSINLAHEALHDFWNNCGMQLIWQTGEGYFSRFSESETAKLPNVHCTPYLNEMDFAYSAADLVYCRAGALSIAELQLLGKPAVLVPSPNVAGDHQTANARAVEFAGGALVVKDTEQVEHMRAEVKTLLSNPLRLAEMAAHMVKQGKPHAATSIAKAILAHVER